MVGKWHLGVGLEGEYLPTRQGFSHYFGLPYSHDMCPFGPAYCYPERDCDSLSPHPFTSPCPLYSGEQLVEQPVNLTSLTSRMTERARSFITDKQSPQQRTAVAKTLAENRVALKPVGYRGAPPIEDVNGFGSTKTLGF